MKNNFYDDDMKALFEVVQRTVEGYSGDAQVLNGAIGFLYSGYFFGWRHLYVAHSKKTVRKYEKILSIKVTGFFDELGRLSHRSAGLNEAAKHSSYWKVASGDIKIPHRNEIMTDDESRRYVLSRPNSYQPGNLY